MTSRTEAELLDEIENADHGEGPDPIASFEGDALHAILTALRDRNAAQSRIDAAVAQARAEKEAAEERWLELAEMVEG